MSNQPPSEGVLELPEPARPRLPAVWGPPTPPSPPNQPLWPKLILGWATLAAFGYFFLIGGRSEHRAPVPTPEPVQGWDELGSCSDSISLDGTKELLLEADGSARILNNSPVKEGEDAGDRGADGDWRLTPSWKHYAVTIGAQTTSYLLVSPSENICILIAGDVAAADLRASWFGSWSGTDVDPGDYEPDRWDR